MRVSAPVTDYLKRSVLTAVGDLLVGDPLDHDRLPSHTAGTVLTATGTGTKPFWGTFKEALTTIGDIFIRGSIGFTRLPSGGLGTCLKGKGAGVLPAYEKLRLDDTGVYIGNSTRNAAGVQAITGVGYQASVIIIFACDEEYSLRNFSWGLSNGAVSYNIRARADMPQGHMSLTSVIYIQNSDIDYIYADLTSITAEGFNLFWTKLGYGGADFIYLCLP